MIDHSIDHLNIDYKNELLWNVLNGISNEYWNKISNVQLKLAGVRKTLETRRKRKGHSKHHSSNKRETIMKSGAEKVEYQLFCDVRYFLQRCNDYIISMAKEQNDFDLYKQEIEKEEKEKEMTKEIEVKTEMQNQDKTKITKSKSKTKGKAKGKFSILKRKHENNNNQSNQSSSIDNETTNITITNEINKEMSNESSSHESTYSNTILNKAKYDITNLACYKELQNFVSQFDKEKE